MSIELELEYWIDDGWYVGRLKGIPGVFSQGATLQELEDNIREVYELMIQDELAAPSDTQTKRLVLERWSGGSSSGN